MYEREAVMTGYEHGLSPRTSTDIYQKYTDRLYKKTPDIIIDPDIKYVSLEQRALELTKRYMRLHSRYRT